MRKKILQHIRVISFRRNFGQTAAIAAGLDYAQGEIIILLDADMQNDPADIPMMLAKLDEGYDLVSGWRKSRKDNALTRNFPSMMANWLISRVTGVHLHDYGCTLKAYRRDVLEGFRFTAKCTALFRSMPALSALKSQKCRLITILENLARPNMGWNERSKLCLICLQ